MPQPSTGLGAPINILLVDDEPKNLTVLETILADPGYRLVLADSADRALLCLVGEEFALLVLDIQMPGMNGFELATMIKKRKKTAAVPIIFLTAYYSEDQHVLEGYGTGAVDYLHKPINPTVLRSKVAVFAELYRKNREISLANAGLSAEAAERERAQDQLRRLNKELEQRVAARTADLVRANAALRESEQRLDLSLKGADLGVWDWNLVTDAVRFDERWTQILGFRVADVPAEVRFWHDRVHPDDRPGLAAGLADHRAGRSAEFRYSYRMRHKNDTWVWVLSCGRIVEADAAGVPLRACGTQLDITAQKSAEEALKRSEAFARRVVECGADCVQVFSPDGRLRWMNENARRWLESFDQDPGRFSDWHSLWDAGGVRAEAELALVAARTSGIGRFQGRWPTPADSSRWWDVAVTPIPGPDGEPEQFLSVARDVTEQRRAEEALLDADRRKDEFLAMLSHELRNPLAPIRNSVEILRRTAPKDPALVAARDMIDRQVSHMVRLVDDLLDVSRVSRGKIQLQKKPLDLMAVVRQAVETSRQLIEARRHQFEVQLPDESVFVDGDFTRLAQVLVNLLDNAAKYTDAGGQVWLTVEPGLDEAVIRVRDTGRGIDPSSLKHVFDLFYQADRNLDRSDGGLGIGLALVRTLVQMHGGTVEAGSDGRGKGSEFVVCLPRLRGTAGKFGPDPFEAERSAVRSLRILIVDDNRDSAESMAFVLRAEGHDVRTAYDGRIAVETAARDRPDVVLLDIGLPGLNGYQVCKALRSRGLSDALIVAATGYGQTEDRRLSQEAGFDAFMVKPVDLAALRELLAVRADRCQPSVSAGG